MLKGAVGGTIFLCLAWVGPAYAEVGLRHSSIVLPFTVLSILAVTGFAVAIFTLFLRRHTLEKQRALQTYLIEAKRRLESLEALLSLTGQCAVIWGAEGKEPHVTGRLYTNSPASAEAFLQFAGWLTPRSVRALDGALTALQENGQSADLDVETLSGRFLHVTGRIFGVQPVLRFQDISADLQESVEQKKRADGLFETLNLAQTLLDKIKAPVWFKDENEMTIWVNSAYRAALDVGENDPLPEFLNENLLDAVKSAGNFYQATANLNIHGERHKFALTTVAADSGSAGLAEDMTREDELENELQQMARGHSDVLDLLPTAVAIFDADQKLRFFNQAFSMLWPLETTFLESMPSHSRLLDQLREKGLIAQQPDWSGWKTALFSVYRRAETIQQIWNLPDGRTLRIIGHSLPQGGVAWLFDNLTEKLDLETRFNTFIMMQGETLDHLSEGVVVFGPDGRIRLSNPAFCRLWSLSPNLAVEGTHINELKKACEKLTVEPRWADFARDVTGISDRREMSDGRINLLDGTVFDYAFVPLPKGQVMMTFVDVTASVNYARTLQEKNEALQTVDKLRNDFVQHVSYELRTPLTNIIGFADFMRTPTLGELNARQREYLDHIGTESGELLNLVNDILDLATVDAGMMKLDITEVHAPDVMQQAISRTQERFQSRSITVHKDIAPDLPTFFADPARINQVFVNLLTNAVNFAPEKSTVRFAAFSEGDEIVFSIHDDGRGIPDEILDSVFKRFSALNHHGSRAGAGLGLSIVESVVKLHGGTVTIDTGPLNGTTVFCRFPIHPQPVYKDKN